METRQEIRKKLEHLDADKLTEAFMWLAVCSLGNIQDEETKQMLSLHIEVIKELMKEKEIETE